MVLLAGCTGLRISEVMGLRWQSIDFERLAMVVTEGWARSQTTKLKFEYTQDELPLNPAVATILLDWKRLCPETSGNWVFPSPRTNRPYDSSSLRKKMLKPAAQRAKDSECDWLAFAASQLSSLARRQWGSTWRSAEADAPRQHFNHDERVWRCVHGGKAQSKHVGRAPGSLQKQSK
jgi:integrase